MGRDAARDRTTPRGVSPLLVRVLAVNLVAPLLLVIGFLYFGEYRNALIRAEQDSLRRHAELIATAMAEGAVREFQGPEVSSIGQAASTHAMALNEARTVLRRALQTLAVRARVFDANGLLVIDSRDLGGVRAPVEVRDLPPPRLRPTLRDHLAVASDRAWAWLDDEADLPPYVEKAGQSAEAYAEASGALGGEAAVAVRRLPGGGKLFSAAVPVQYYKEVVGALMLSKGGEEIDDALRKVRRTLIEMFVVTLGVTVMLSLYLARTIAAPLTRLAQSAQRVRHGHGRHLVHPEFERRGDEIGVLSASLNEMTTALWARMDAIESFAADVAHEIKNPLTSLRSAVETAARIDDPARRDKLMAIVLEDVERLDRLITDISNASRLDAELSRAEAAPVDLCALLGTLAEVHGRGEGRGRVVLGAVPDEPLVVSGIAGRLAQVFANLLSNAVSFSPPDGVVTLAAARDGGFAIVTVTDQGPGIPEAAAERLFERFYTERLEGEKFGRHSGLGLSISKQIVEAHDGTITAENARDKAGVVTGARFIVRLPLA